MTDAQALRAEAARMRAAAAGSEAMPTPRGRPERQPVRIRSEMRAKRVDRNGKDWHVVEGYASAFERGYEMWDFFGPYTEIVSASAADETLAADPFVIFRFNHGGMPMATTEDPEDGNRFKRLELWADSTGLGDRAWLNPMRSDVKLLVQAMEDGDVREQSFMFTITAGQWSPDYTEYRIQSFDLDRGDVGPVTYGANSYTSVAARSAEFLADIPKLPPLMAREAYTLLRQRPDLAASPAPAPAEERIASEAKPAEGRSIALVRTRLLIGDDEED